MGRTIAFGDIHGCIAALDALLSEIDPIADDTLVFLGDYIDRGPDSAEVIRRVIGLQQTCNVVPLLGNHEAMMLMAKSACMDLFMCWANQCIKAFGQCLY